MIPNIAIIMSNHSIEHNCIEILDDLIVERIFPTLATVLTVLLDRYNVSHLTDLLNDAGQSVQHFSQIRVLNWLATINQKVTNSSQILNIVAYPG